MKLLTLDDYKKAGETFWPKYWYVAQELGENAKPEEVLKVIARFKKFIVKSMNIDIFLISFFTYLLVPVVMIAKGKKVTY